MDAITKNERVGVKTAHKVLGITKEGLERGLQQGRFPFGVAVKHQIEWTYYIWLHPLLKYLDMTYDEYEELIKNAN